MKKILLLILATATLYGCATPKQIVAPVVPPKSEEPLIVGIPIQDRLSASATRINQQLDLLNRIRAGSFVGEHAMVEHNLQLDARKGSQKTLPQDYAFKEEIRSAREEANEIIVAEQNRIMAILNTKVENIEWQEKSANELAKHFASLFGYDLAITPHNRDIKINFSVKNITVLEAMQKFQQKMLSHADVFIVDENKTFNIVYR